jgi:mannose-6-phosphate isomerase-like protein (cupin superfamily)
MSFEFSKSYEKDQVYAEVRDALLQNEYEIVEENTNKPWGAYFRLNGEQADKFIEEYFPGLSPVEARLGNLALELSPKILVAAPDQRLSWQYHHRRAERWNFLTEGLYAHSAGDDEVDPIVANPGEVVQFDKGERHRLIGAADKYTVVAEIWQHTDPQNPSNEDDIVRLQDDYSR